MYKKIFSLVFFIGIAAQIQAGLEGSALYCRDRHYAHRMLNTLITNPKRCKSELPLSANDINRISDLLLERKRYNPTHYAFLKRMLAERQQFLQDELQAHPHATLGKCVKHTLVAGVFGLLTTTFWSLAYSSYNNPNTRTPPVQPATGSLCGLLTVFPTAAYACSATTEAVDWWHGENANIRHAKKLEGIFNRIDTACAEVALLLKDKKN